MHLSRKRDFESLPLRNVTMRFNSSPFALLLSRVARPFSVVGSTSVALLLAFALTTGSSQAASLRTQELSVDDPRPLAAALDVLQDLHGVPITYEDPVLSHPGDLVPLAEFQTRDGAFIPRGGHLSIKYLVDTGTGALADPLRTIEKLIEKHAAKGYPGRFRVDELDGVFHVTPIAARSSSGGWLAQFPALATPLPLASGASGLETVTNITEGLGAVLGREVWGGMMPTGALLRLPAPTTFGTEPARDVLVRLLRELDGVASWRLFYDPTLDIYALNIHRSLPTVSAVEMLEEPPAAFEGSKRKADEGR